ncbi:UNVERIFIED_ORG: hypothetical protein GGI57_006565 [Rhizobium aethiopicum]
MQFLDARASMLLPRRETFLDGHAVYAALDLEERVNAGDGLKCDGRYLVGRLALAHVAGDVGQFEELAPGMAPAECALDRRRAAVRTVEVVVATIGIGLQGAVPSGEMRVGGGFSRSGEKWKSAAGGAPPAKGRSSRT